MQDRPNAARFVVGLGNPGRQYARTRHNVGFMVLAELRRRGEFGPARSKFHGKVWSGRLAGRPVTMLAPQTFMNRSGLSVAEMLSFYKAPTESLLIVLDDMALPPGRIRFRAAGSAGGHNGLGDIAAALATNDLARLRVGIGEPDGPMDGKDHVLSEFEDSQKTVMAEAISRAASAVEDWIARGGRYVMDRYNPKPTDKDAVKEGGNGQ